MGHWVAAAVTALIDRASLVLNRLSDATGDDRTIHNSRSTTRLIPMPNTTVYTYRMANCFNKLMVSSVT